MLRYSVPFLSAFLFPNSAAFADEPAEKGAVAQEVREDGEPVSAVPRHGVVSVDPLGFLLFGPTVNGEFAVGQFGIGAGFRWFSPGLLANELFLRSSDGFAFSYGFAARGQYYFLEPLAGPHVGLALDYLHVRVDNDVKGIATISDYLVPQIEGGYRHFFGRFFVGGSVAIGYAAQVGSRVENLPGNMVADSYSVSDESSVYGTGRIDLGLSF